MLELSVEATFPSDETTVTAIILISSSLQGALLIEMERLFSHDEVTGDKEEVLLS